MSLNVSSIKIAGSLQKASGDITLISANPAVIGLSQTLSTITLTPSATGVSLFNGKPGAITLQSPDSSLQIGYQGFTNNLNISVNPSFANTGISTLNGVGASITTIQDASQRPNSLQFVSANPSTINTILRSTLMNLTSPITWNSATTYYTGDVVVLNGNTYVANNLNANQNPPLSPAVWTQLGSQVSDGTGISTINGIGASTMTIQQNPATTQRLNALTFQSLGNTLNIGLNPNFTNFDNTTFLYNASSNYQTGDLVMSGGQTWSAIQDAPAGNAPPTSGTSNAYWAKLATYTDVQGIANLNGLSNSVVNILNASARTDALTFITPGSFSTLGVIVNPKYTSFSTGTFAWNASNPYLQGDIVYSTDSNTYVATQSNSNAIPQSNVASWTKLGVYAETPSDGVGISTLNTLGATNITLSSAPTAPADIVFSNTTASNIQLFNNAMSYKGVWDSATPYVSSQVVQYNSNFYIALSNNTNSAPQSNVNPAWGEFAGSGTTGMILVPDPTPTPNSNYAWQSNIAYSANDVVSFSGDGNLYVAVQGSSNNNPSVQPNVAWTRISGFAGGGSITSVNGFSNANVFLNTASYTPPTVPTSWIPSVFATTPVGQRYYAFSKIFTIANPLYSLPGYGSNVGYYGTIQGNLTYNIGQDFCSPSNQPPGQIQGLAPLYSYLVFSDALNIPNGFSYSNSNAAPYMPTSNAKTTEQELPWGYFQGNDEFPPNAWLNPNPYQKIFPISIDWAIEPNATTGSQLSLVLSNSVSTSNQGGYGFQISPVAFQDCQITINATPQFFTPSNL